MKYALSLIFIGAVLILSPLVVWAWQEEAHRNRVAEVLSRNGNASGLAVFGDGLPANYDWACWFAGYLSLGVGILAGWKSRRHLSTGKPSAPDLA